jgi:D-hydroxyproline dehydrogenase subunit gamma
VRVAKDSELLPRVERGTPFEVTVDGAAALAYPGETVAAVLAATGRRILHRTEHESAPRGFYCGIGLCFGCLVMVDDLPGVRACVTLARPGMCVRTAGAEPTS